MAPAPKQQAPRAVQTICTNDDYAKLVQYMEHPGNMDLLFGAGKKTGVDGKLKSKSSNWALAATELESVGFQKTTGRNLYKKWQRYVTKYRLAKDFAEGTGAGITEEEHRMGITLELKLNDMCDHYYKMDALLGSRSNITPPAVSGPMGFQKFPGATEFAKGDEASLSSASVQSDEGDQDPDWMNLSTAQFPESNEIPDTQQTEGTQLEFLGSTEGIKADTQPPSTAQQTKKVQKSAEDTTHGKKSAGDTAQGKKIAGDTAQGKRAAEPDKQKAGKVLKPSLAMAYLEGKLQESELKASYFEKKSLWKMAEIRDKTDARAHQLLLEGLAREVTLAEASRNRDHELEMARSRNKLDLILAGLAQKLTGKEISAMCSLLEGKVGDL